MSFFFKGGIAIFENHKKLKTMKKLSFFCFVALLIFFSACEKQNLADGLHIRVINETDFVFDNISIDDFDFGKIRKQKKTRYKNFESVRLMADYPDIIGNIDEQVYKVSRFTTFCPFDSLEPYTDTLTEGTYTIRIMDYKGCPFIFWENDN